MLHSRMFALVLATVTITSAAHAQLSFQTARNVAAGDGTTLLATSAIASGDFDGDTDIDLVVANRDTDEVVVLINNGSGVFARSTTINVGTRPISIAAVDLNGDDVLDLAVALLGDDQVTVMLGVGDGTFDVGTPYDVGVGPTPSPVHITAADIDGDDSLDLVTANSQDSTVSILFNSGDADATFDAPLNFTITLPGGPSNARPSGAAVGDFNADGHGDLALALRDLDQVGVLLNDGADDFDPNAVAVYDVQRDPIDVETADLDADGDLDLVVANMTLDTVSVLLGDGAGDFAVAANYLAGNNPSALALADMDGDGNLDVVTANCEGDTVSVLLGNGDGTLGTPNPFSVGGYPFDVVIGDFNADGDLDIATANQEGDLVQGDDVSVLLAGIPIIEPDLVDCGAGCGPAGMMPLLLTFVGLVGMKRSRRRIGIP